MRKQILHIVLVLLLSVGAVAFLAWPAPKAMAANPATINFQGRVTNPDGTNESSCTSSCSFVFRLYDQSSPTTTGNCASNVHCWWEETDTLNVTNGVFQVQLGGVCAFTGACNSSHSGINWNTSNALYLTMQFNGDSAGFMTPTIPLTSVPYAYNSDALGGLAAGNFVQLAQGAQAVTSNSNPLIYLNQSGTANILRLQKSNVDTVVVDNSGSLLLGQSNAGGLNGKLTFNNSSNANTLSILTGATTGTYSITLPLASAGGTNYCLVGTTSAGNTTTSFMPCGAGSTAVVSISAEYPGAVMTADGSNNTGTMTSDFCSGSGHLNIPSSGNPCGASQEMNYYAWTANATNDYDVWVRWQAPSDIASSTSFGTVSMYGWTTSASDSVQLTFYNSSGASCGSATVSAASTQFTSASFTPSSSCNVSGGQYVTARVHLNVGASGEYARAGDIVINYNRS